MEELFAPLIVLTDSHKAQSYKLNWNLQDYGLYSDEYLLNYRADMRQEAFGAIKESDLGKATAYERMDNNS